MYPRVDELILSELRYLSDGCEGTAIEMGRQRVMGEDNPDGFLVKGAMAGRERAAF